MFAEDPRLALTFDDISIVPGLSSAHPNEVDLRTLVCRGISLNIPILSAAMDTVTESRLAIALAQQGGMASSTRTCRSRSRPRRSTRSSARSPG